MDEDVAPRLAEPEDSLLPYRAEILRQVREVRRLAGSLRPDQEAFSALAEDLLLGTAMRQPELSCRILAPGEIPGGELSPFQSESLAAWQGALHSHQPTNEAIKRHCRRQLRRLQEGARDPEAAKLYTETISARPHANDPEGLCLAAEKDGGHPQGGAPTLPLPSHPPRVIVQGEQLPSVDIAALCALHASAGSGCEECNGGKPCWINVAAKILSGVDLLTEEGFASAELRKDPIEPAEVDAPMLEKAGKLLLQGVIHEAPPGSVDHYNTIFLAAAGSSAILDAKLQELLDGGGPRASIAAAAEATRLAELLAAAYLASQPSTPTQCRAAWEAAEGKLFTPPKLRVVIDFSQLSSHAPQLRMRYPELAEALAHVEGGWWICKLDVKSGFYHVLLSERSKRLTGFSLRWYDGRVRHFRFSRLLMGARVSPWVFSLLTAIILSILRARGFASVSLVFVDDFILFARSKEECERALQELKDILKALNILFAADKTSVEAVQQEVALGLLCDLQGLTLSLPSPKLVRLLARAGALEILASASKTFPSYVLASVAGGVCNLARVDSCVAPGARALASYFQGQGGRHGWARWKSSQHVTTAAEAEALRWLRTWAESGFLRASRFLPNGSPQPVIDFTTDASGPSNALGITTQVTRLRVNLPGCGSLGVYTLESLGRPVFLQEYAWLAPGFHFRQGCDSMSVCYMQIKGSAREPTDNDLCAVSSVAMRHAGQSASTLMISRYVNGISDRLSAERVEDLAARGYLQPGEGVELTYEGLPPTFLARLKTAAKASLPWRDPQIWAKITKRE